MHFQAPKNSDTVLHVSLGDFLSSLAKVQPSSCTQPSPTLLCALKDIPLDLFISCCLLNIFCSPFTLKINFRWNPRYTVSLVAFSHQEEIGGRLSKIKAAQGQMRTQKHILNVSCPGLSLLLCHRSSQFLAVVTFVVSPLKNLPYSISELSLRAGGRGFSPATKRVAPGYFYWKIEEKQNQKKSLAI